MSNQADMKRSGIFPRRNRPMSLAELERRYTPEQIRRGAGMTQENREAVTYYSHDPR